MFADIGYEETETKGLGWIAGKVSKIDNQNGKFKLPHIGWNQINIIKTLFQSSKGEIILLLDSDDCFEKDKLKKISLLIILWPIHHYA